MDYSKLDDQALLRLIVHKKQEALGVLYDRYVRLVYSMAYNAVGDHSAAEEIVQDVFFNIWEKAHTYRQDQARVSTWLTSITRYRAIDQLRKRGSRAEQHSVGWSEVPAQMMPVESEGPEEAAARSLQSQRVRAALKILPPEQREALALAYFMGLSHSEISETLGEPLGTIKTRIRLGMQKLRDALQSETAILK